MSSQKFIKIGPNHTLNVDCITQIVWDLQVTREANVVRVSFVDGTTANFSNNSFEANALRRYFSQQSVVIDLTNSPLE